VRSQRLGRGRRTSNIQHPTSNGPAKPHASECSMMNEECRRAGKATQSHLQATCKPFAWEGIAIHTHMRPFALSPSRAIKRMPSVVSNYNHADAVRPLAKQQVIRKTTHVGPPQTTVRKVEPLRPC
jgi:hypothetical protein